MAATSPRLTGAGVLLCAAALTSCGGQGHGTGAPQAVAKASPPTSPTVTPSAGSPKSSEAEVRQTITTAYLDFMGAWHMAAFNPSDQGAKLADYALGQALERTKADIQKSRREGTIGKGPVEFDPTVTRLDLQSNPPTAFIDDCVDATHYLTYRASDGSLVGTPDSDTRRQHITAHLLDVGGTWKVDEFHIYQPGSCR